LLEVVMLPEVEILPEVIAVPLTLPAVEMVPILAWSMAAEVEMSALTIPEIVALSTRSLSLVGVTTSLDVKILPLVSVAMVI
jgi:hypothetical protein